MIKTKTLMILGVVLLVLSGSAEASFFNKETRKAKQQEEVETLQKDFAWWPTDARPGAVKDPARGGYWWWPKAPGSVTPWGNRGYVYVFKIIFDYKEEELPAPEPGEMRPSLLVRKIYRNVKVYFDYDKADIREDAAAILRDAVRLLEKNPSASILITGNADIRGSENYNDKLGKRRADSVKQLMISENVAEDRIRLVSRGKLDAVAPVTDLVGMQKDRNAQFMVADVDEVMIPYQGEGPAVAQGAQQIEEGKYIVEEKAVVESDIKVSTQEYVVKKGDTLSGIAQEHLGSGHRWKYLYEINKDRIKNPDRLIPGTKIVIPIE